MMFKRNPAHPWNNELKDEFFRLIGTVARDENGELRSMVMGVLMFRRDYSIAREVPGYMLGYLEYADGGEAWTTV